MLLISLLKITKSVQNYLYMCVCENQISLDKA